jgi:protocatechuate 3,4-dioxygenase, alpha subunit
VSRHGQTPSQTVGPYYSMRLFATGQNLLVSASAPDRIRIEGRVLDGDRKPIEDALIELWQANEHGRYRHPDDDRAGAALRDGFTGFGRAAAHVPDGEFWFETLKPGRTPGPDGSWQAPHLSLLVQGRGILAPAFTRLYFADEAEANARDFVLERVPAARRATLIAVKLAGGELPTYRLEIRYQGPDETVFFDF